MKYIDLTLSTPAENLACDEALLDWCEEDEGPELLRFWEPQQSFVVIGYANRAAVEVNLAACRELAVPVHRRASGGGTVLQGPGCLNYSLVLKIQPDGPLHSIPATNAFILDRHRRALETLLGPGVQRQGSTDLTTGGLKFSGNAQRRRRHHLLFHGTFLLQFDLALMEKVLRLPSKQPAYRRGRSHGEFLTHLPMTAADLKGAMRQAWNADEWLEAWPGERVKQLVAAHYGREEWNFRL